MAMDLHLNIRRAHGQQRGNSGRYRTGMMNGQGIRIAETSYSFTAQQMDKIREKAEFGTGSILKAYGHRETFF
ncbi:hypothetical protein D3C75_1337710 [compost metagenome]